MKRALSIFVCALMAFVLVGCGSANSAIKSLENEGLTVESADQTEMDSFIEEYSIEGFKNLHYVYSESDKVDSLVLVGIIVEYKSSNALEDALGLSNEDGLGQRPSNIYKNCLIIELSLSYDLMEIILE